MLPIPRQNLAASDGRSSKELDKKDLVQCRSRHAVIGAKPFLATLPSCNAGNPLSSMWCACGNEIEVMHSLGSWRVHGDCLTGRRSRPSRSKSAYS